MKSIGFMSLDKTPVAHLTEKRITFSKAMCNWFDFIKLEKYACIKLKNTVNSSYKEIEIKFFDKQKPGSIQVGTNGNGDSFPLRLAMNDNDWEKLKFYELDWLNLEEYIYEIPVIRPASLDRKVILQTRMSRVARKASRKKKDSPKSEPKQNDLQNDYTAKMKLAEGWDNLALETSKMIEDPKAKVITQYLEEAKKCRQQMNTEQE